MSKIQQVYTVTPPMFLREHGYTESVLSKGHLCPVCVGTGYYTTKSKETGETLRVPCETCQGARKLDAEITIKWTPAAK